MFFEVILANVKLVLYGIIIKQHAVILLLTKKMIQIKFRIKSNFISVKWDSVMKNQACLNDTSCYDTMVCSNNVCDCEII